jgi:hypothetical protein
MESECLYRFSVYFGRMGDLSGLFIAFPSDVAALKGKELHLGECLGKHSDVLVVFRGEEITRVDVAESTVIDMLRVCGNTISGINPVAEYAARGEEDR